MRRSARWGMGTAGLLMAASSSAYGAGDRATREAEARFAEGLSRVKKQDYEAARLSFEQAYAVLHRPLILWNLALSEEKSGHPLEAIAHFRQVTHDAPADADRANAQRHIDALNAQLSRIDLQAPSGTTFVLDGSDVAGAAPLGDPIDIKPGHHIIVAKMLAGTSTVTKTNEIDANPGITSHVTFAPDVPAATALVATATPPAAPTEAQPPPPAPDQSDTTKPFWTGRTIAAVTFGGAAVVAVGFGAVFGVESQNNKSTVSNYQQAHGNSACSATPQPAYCGTWNNAVNAQNRDATVSNALYFVGGALAVGAVVSWFFWPKQAHGAAAWVAPAVGPGLAGVGAGGRF